MFSLSFERTSTCVKRLTFAHGRRLRRVSTHAWLNWPIDLEPVENIYISKRHDIYEKAVSWSDSNISTYLEGW